MTYVFQSGTADIAGTQETAAVLEGMNMWSQVSRVKFAEGNPFTADSFIKWAIGDHGDGSSNAFDGPGKTLAHAALPCKSDSQNIHFDDDETWTTSFRPTGGQPIDLVSVAAHEAGHAIGLDHSADPDSLLFKTESAGGYAGSHRYLAWDDILGAQILYGRGNGIFHLRNSNTTGAPNNSFLFQNLNDKPLTGDWNGDGIDTIGVYRPSNQTFYLDNSNVPGNGADITFAFGSGANGAGSSGDRPVIGDWNGDGIDTVGVYRPSNGAFYLRNSNSAGVPFTVFGFGNNEDLPIAGDWNGNGVDTIGVYRPSNGSFYMKDANDGVPPVDYTIPYGNSGSDDLPAIGDWNGNGTDTIGIYRLSEARFYLSDSLSPPVANIVPFYGINAFGEKVANRLPVTGNWDGVGGASIGLFQN